MTSDQIMMETRENTEGIKVLNTQVERMRMEALDEKDKRHEVHDEFLKENKATKELMNTLVALSADTKTVIFGCDKLQINGLVKDNQKNKAFNKKLTWMWAGITVAGATFTAAIGIWLKLSGKL